MSQPSTIGSYAVLGELGRGGMGVVYRARHPEGQEVAIKVVLDPLEGEARARFEREAWACAQLAHPRLVRVLDVGAERGRPFLVLDYVRGVSLAERLKREGALEADLACEIVAELARGGAHAHAQGILHRDIKPANVLIDEQGEPVLTDFGLARVAESHLTRTGQILGTPAFMAPEQADAGAPDARADVYGLGATLYALLCGQPPFVGRGTLALLNAVLSEAPTPLRERVPGIDPALAALVERCLAKDPEERPASAAALADALDELRLASRSRQRGGPAFALGILVLILALGLGAAGLWLGEPEEAAPREGSAASPPPSESESALASASPEATLGAAEQGHLESARRAWLCGAEERATEELDAIEGAYAQVACLRAWVLYDWGQLERSEAAVERLLERWPSYAPAHALRAVQLAQRSNAEASAQALAVARSQGLAPLDEARVLAWQGHYARLHHRQGAPSRAEVSGRFRRLLELEPRDMRAEAILISHEAAEEGGWGAREPELRALVERAPELGLAWYFHTNALRESLAPEAKRGARDALASVVERGVLGVSRNPRDPLCLANAAIALLTPQGGGNEAGRLEVALRHLERLETAGARDLEVCRRATDALEFAWRIVRQATGKLLGPQVKSADVFRVLNDGAAQREARGRLPAKARRQLEQALGLSLRTRRLMEHFSRGLAERFPACASAYAYEIGALYAQGRYDEALQLCLRQVELWPGSDYARKRAISLARLAGKPELSQRLDQERERWRSELRPALAQRRREAAASWRGGRNEEALRALEGAEWIELRCLRAWVLHDLHRLRESEALAKAAIDEDARHPEAAALIAVHYAQHNDFPRFASALERARAFGAGAQTLARAEAWGAHLRALHDLPGGEEDTRALARLRSLDPGYQYGALLALRDRVRRAGWGEGEAAELTRLCEEAPALGEVWLLAVERAEREGSADAALAQAQAGIAASQSPFPRVALGLHFSLQGQAREALDQLEQAAATGCDSLAFRAQAARVAHGVMRALGEQEQRFLQAAEAKDAGELERWLDKTPNARRVLADLRALRMRAIALGSSLTERFQRSFPDSRSALLARVDALLDAHGADDLEVARRLNGYLQQRWREHAPVYLQAQEVARALGDAGAAEAARERYRALTR